MEYLARKISRAKWDSVSHNNVKDIQADALTSCLRTQSNELSVWQCDTTRMDVSEIVLALTLVDFKDIKDTRNSKNRIDKMYIVLLEKNHEGGDEVNLKSSPGNTIVGDLKDRHRDITDLTMTKLCDLARRVFSQVETYDGKETCKTSCLHSFTRKQVTDIVRDAVKSVVCDGDMEINPLME